VAAAAMPATSNMPATTAMPAEVAMLAFAAMLTEFAMLTEVAKPIVAVINGPVPNGLRHATGQGKTDADHKYGPRKYAVEFHCRLRFL
jgi:hypothetical protein